MANNNFGDDYNSFYREYNDWISEFAYETGNPDEFESVMETMFDDIEDLLATRDLIIKECLDKEKLEKAKSRLALSKTLHSRLGADTPLNKDIMDKINKNLTGRGKSGKKRSKKRNSKKRKNTKRKSK